MAETGQPVVGDVLVKKGYANGSDMLLFVDDKAVGHCSSHTLTCSSETKKHSVKPPASQKSGSGLFSGISVTGLSISVKTDSLMFYDEEECSYADLLKIWKSGKPVKLKCMERNADKPYCVGAFAIASLEMTSPAQDDITCSASFENAGAPETLDETALT